MDITILDGTGGGNSARVDGNKRLHTDGVVREEIDYAILTGDGYNLTSGSVTLTNDSESVLFHLKNNEDSPLVIKEFLYILGSSTGGSGNGLARLYKNPTGGTIVTNALALNETNRNFSSAKVITGDKYRGVQGDTTTGGTNPITSARDTFDEPIAFDAAYFVLEKGNSIALSWQPPSGNTSQSIVIAMTCFVNTLSFNGD